MNTTTLNLHTQSGLPSIATLEKENPTIAKTNDIAGRAMDFQPETVNLILKTKEILLRNVEEETSKLKSLTKNYQELSSESDKLSQKLDPLSKLFGPERLSQDEIFDLLAEVGSAIEVDGLLYDLEMGKPVQKQFQRLIQEAKEKRIQLHAQQVAIFEEAETLWTTIETTKNTLEKAQKSYDDFSQQLANPKQDPKIGKLKIKGEFQLHPAHRQTMQSPTFLDGQKLTQKEEVVLNETAERNVQKMDGKEWEEKNLPHSGTKIKFSETSEFREIVYTQSQRFIFESKPETGKAFLRMNDTKLSLEKEIESIKNEINQLFENNPRRKNRLSLRHPRTGYSEKNKIRSRRNERNGKRTKFPKNHLYFG